ncbi:hypothetical protein Tco_0759885 [Tanacetum coccineum]
MEYIGMKDFDNFHMPGLPRYYVVFSAAGIVLVGTGKSDDGWSMQFRSECHLSVMRFPPTLPHIVVDHQDRCNEGLYPVSSRFVQAEYSAEAAVFEELGRGACFLLSLTQHQSLQIHYNGLEPCSVYMFYSGWFSMSLVIVSPPDMCCWEQIFLMSDVGILEVSSRGALISMLTDEIPPP